MLLGGCFAARCRCLAGARAASDFVRPESSVLCFKLVCVRACRAAGCVAEPDENELCAVQRTKNATRIAVQRQLCNEWPRWLSNQATL